MQAIAYARKYLAPWGATHMKELQRVMATLAFKSSTECAVYKVNCLVLFLQCFKLKAVHFSLTNQICLFNTFIGYIRMNYR